MHSLAGAGMSRPRAEAFLAVERQYITAPWTLGKIALTAFVPVWFAALAWAFWQR